MQRRSYRDGIYNRRGGDESLDRRYAQLVEIAREDGLLDRLRQTEAGQVAGTAFGRLLDFFEREQAASASVWDVMFGEPDEGDTVGGRWIREAFGGTKLGNFLGVEDRRTGEDFWDVFEQMGMPEGWRPSDTFGKTGLFKYIDPSTRDFAALSASVLLTPTTWLTGGAGGGVKWVGRAGSVGFVPTKAAQRLATRQYQKMLVKGGKRLGLVDDVGAALKTADRALESNKLGKEWFDLEEKILMGLRNESAFKGLNKMGDQIIKSQLHERATRVVARLHEAGKVHGLGGTERDPVWFDSMVGWQVSWRAPGRFRDARQARQGTG